MAAEKILPCYQIVDGHKLCAAFEPAAFREAVSYKPQDDDLFIITYPKCGTTWSQQIVYLLQRDGQPVYSIRDLRNSVPFIEMVGQEGIDNMKRPGALKTHSPYHLTPQSPKAKYLVVVRNPKDSCVSFFHHTRGIPGYNFENGSFDDFFELFITGKTDYGDYFDHLLSWWEHRNDANVMFLTYESMKEDVRKVIKDIAAFMGDEYAKKLDTDPDLMENIVKYSSIEYMKTMDAKMPDFMLRPYDELMNDPKTPRWMKITRRCLEKKPGDTTKTHFIRKGEVNDWKNHMTDEQNDRLKKRFVEKTQGTGIEKLWPKECFGWF